MTATKSKSKMMRQVKLVREDRRSEDVFWIDNRQATVGKHVIDEAGVIWRVAEAYNARHAEACPVYLHYFDPETERALYEIARGGSR